MLVVWTTPFPLPSHLTPRSAPRCVPRRLRIYLRLRTCQVEWIPWGLAVPEAWGRDGRGSVKARRSIPLIPATGMNLPTSTTAMSWVTSSQSCYLWARRTLRFFVGLIGPQRASPTRQAWGGRATNSWVVLLDQLRPVRLAWRKAPRHASRSLSLV